MGKLGGGRWEETVYFLPRCTYYPSITKRDRVLLRLDRRESEDTVVLGTQAPGLIGRVRRDQMAGTQLRHMWTLFKTVGPDVSREKAETSCE